MSFSLQVVPLAALVLKPLRSVDYYEESKKRKNEFSKTLERFVEIMKTRQLYEKLNIPLKKAGSYSVDDVLGIATKLQDSHKDCKNLNPCLRVIRKCFRTAGEHSGTIQTFLKFIPSDSYGSIICGGLTMILAVSPE